MTNAPDKSLVKLSTAEIVRDDCRNTQAAFCCLPRERTGADLIAVMQASPHRDIDLAPERAPTDAVATSRAKR